jgi:chain length determinant protein EpsF
VDFGQFFRVLRARYRLVLAVMLASVGTSVMVSLLVAPRYNASTTLLVDVQTTDPLMGTSVSSLSTVQGYLATQVDVLKSLRVVNRVIDSLNLARDDYFRKRWEKAVPDHAQPIGDWLASELLERASFDPGREASTITLTVEGHEPRFAALLADTWAQSYLKTALELRVGPARDDAGWFEERSRTFREELAAAQTRLSAFQRKSGIVASDERLDVENSRLQELSTQWVNLQSQSADSRSRAAALSRQGQDVMPEVVQNPLLQTLKADLGRAQARVEELAAQFGDAHPQLQAARAQAGALRERLAAEQSRVTGSILASAAVNAQREREIHEAMQAQRERVLRLKQDRDELAVLQREVDRAQKALEVVTQRLTQTSLESQTQHSNVSILSAARVPAQPSRPRPALNAAVGIFVGLLLAVFAAFTLERVRAPLRTVEDLAAFVDTPVLAVLPTASSRQPQRLIAALRAPPSQPPGPARLTS